MRKRLLAFLTSAALLLCLPACGAETPKWEPGRASAEIEPYARRAIEIIDGYLAFEMTTEEATEAFRELRKRMNPTEIWSVDSEYSEPDQVVAQIISGLTIGQADYRTDLEYREYRDVLAFQIGEEVSGKVYKSDRSVLSDKDAEMAVFIDLENMPFDFSSVDKYEEFCAVSVWFDTRNGVSIPILQKCIEDAHNAMSEQSFSTAHLGFYIRSYDQSVLSISISVNEGTFLGTVLREDSAAQSVQDKFYEEFTLEERIAMEDYPEEYKILDPLYEFDSIEYLHEALAVASAFAGIE